MAGPLRRGRRPTLHGPHSAAPLLPAYISAPTGRDRGRGRSRTGVLPLVELESSVPLKNPSPRTLVPRFVKIAKLLHPLHNCSSDPTLDIAT